MRDDPVVSVVVPVYNRQNVIGKCLASIQGQTQRDWEAIVVDDGSFDGTADVVEELAREDSRLALIRLDTNRGAQAARNVGIRASRARWVAFLDSDDKLLPDSLQTRLEAAAATGSPVVHSECLVRKRDGSIRRYNIRPLSGRVYSDLLIEEGPVFPALMVRRSALERIGLLDEQLVAFQEWDTVIRLAKHYRFAFVPEPTFVWDRQQLDTISGDFVRNGRGYEQVLHKHYLAILRHLGPRALGRHYNIAARWYARAGARGELRRCQLLALMWMALDPRSVITLMRSALGRARRATISRLVGEKRTG